MFYVALATSTCAFVVSSRPGRKLRRGKNYLLYIPLENWIIYIGHLTIKTLAYSRHSASCEVARRTVSEKRDEGPLTSNTSPLFH